MERIKSSGDEQHKCSMKKMLRRAPQDSQREIQELAAENARLEELEAENAWLKEVEVLNGQLEAENALLKAENARVKDLEAENQLLEKLRAENDEKMVEKLKSSASLLLKYSDNQTTLIQLVESEKAIKRELAKELRNTYMGFKVKEEEVVSLNADLKLQQDKLQRYILKNEGRSEEIEELQNKIRDFDESWGEERKKMIEKLESSASLLLKYSDDQTSLFQLVESEKAKKKELAKELRNMNMSFKVKEEEVVKREDDIKLLIQQNIVLQEQALRTDSYKERVKKEKEEKKEREKEEKMKKKEMKKEEKMKKKERKKREKEENEGTTRRRRFPCFLFNFKPS